MPASPDFSGWNWVAESGPFSTAARNRPAVARPRQAAAAGNGGWCSRSQLDAA